MDAWVLLVRQGLVREINVRKQEVVVVAIWELGPVERMAVWLHRHFVLSLIIGGRRPFFVTLLYCEQNLAAFVAQLRSPLSKVVKLEHVLLCVLCLFGLEEIDECVGSELGTGFCLLHPNGAYFAVLTENLFYQALIWELCVDLEGDENCCTVCRCQVVARRVPDD